MIRRAEIKDIGRLNELLFQIQAIHAGARPDIFKIGAKKYTDDELAAIIADDDTPIFVLEIDGAVAGYAFCVYKLTEENDQLQRRKVLYLDDLCVDSRYRRQGVGTQLYKYVLKTAEENGCDSVTLNVWRVNDEARRFYEKMGMEPLKTMMEARLGQDKV